jgi:hypothetical protein
MASTDYMLRLLDGDGGLFERYIKRLDRFYENVPGTGEREAVTAVNGSGGYFNRDKSKIVLSINSDTDGNKVNELFKSKYKLRMEMSDERSILAITSVADTDEGFEKLIYAVNDLNKKLAYTDIKKVPVSFPIPVTVCTPCEALNRKTEKMSLRSAEGRAACSYVMRYPPGVPLLAPGELITEYIINSAREAGLINQEANVII